MPDSYSGQYSNDEWDAVASVLDSGVPAINTERVNSTHRVKPSDDLESVVNNDLEAGDHLIIDSESGADAHAVNSTLTFSVPCSIEFRGYVKPTGDFRTLEFNSVSGTYTIAPAGDTGYVARDDDSVTTSGTDGVVFHNSYSTTSRGRVDDFGGTGVAHLQESTGDKVNHSDFNWIIGNPGQNGLRIENTTGNLPNVNGGGGRVHVFNAGDDAVHVADGLRLRIYIIGANGNAGTQVLSETNSGDVGDNLYWVEEEGFGDTFDGDLAETSRAYLVSSDNDSSGGCYQGNPRHSVTFEGTDGVLPANRRRVIHVDSDSAHTFTLPSNARTGTIFTVKDTDGNAGTNTIAIDTEATGDIDGGSSVSINTNYGWREFVNVGRSGDPSWRVIGSN